MKIFLIIALVFNSLICLAGLQIISDQRSKFQDRWLRAEIKLVDERAAHEKTKKELDVCRSMLAL